MPVTTALVAGGAGTVAGGLMGYLTKPNLSASTNSAKLQALTALLNRPPEIPEVELQKYSTPEALSYLGNFTPEELQATGLPAGVRNAEVTNQLRNNIRNLQKQKDDLISQSSGMDVAKVPVYQQYLNQLGKTKQELLSQYDPTRLSRIQALQQLSGSIPFTPLLQQRLS